MDNINALIEQAIKSSGQIGYQNNYLPLGGGEMNDTFLLDFADNKKLVLRIARYDDQKSLLNEANAFRLLNSEHIPRLVYYDEQNLIANKLWILESYIEGTNVGNLNTKQFNSLGKLLAEVHRVKSTNSRIDVWQHFIKACSTFGNEYHLISHPDTRLRELIAAAKNYFKSEQPKFDTITPVLVHGDATPSNILVKGDLVSLIDWEFSHFNDPMAEFPTIYYDDMEYNKGKWRVHISSDERNALFEGYEEAGGIIDQERLKLWMVFDKLGAAVYLYWRINISGRNNNSDQLSQYRLDFKKLIDSLEKSLS